MFAKHSRRTEKEKGDDTKLLIDQLGKWQIPITKLDRVHDAARKSLDEVKALTEYEDGKASRLLTVITFLSAVVAAVFTRFASDYSWPQFAPLSSQWLLPTATYILFLIYVILVTWAVWSILGAIRPTFNMPKTWTDGGRTGRPTSMVFYKGILDDSAVTWGRTFMDATDPDGIELKAYYAKNYIHEAYLVAEKVAEKLAALEPGIKALRGALVTLILFFVLFGATILIVSPTRSSPTAQLHTISSFSPRAPLSHL